MIANFSKRQITFVVNIVLGSALLKDSPLYCTRFVVVFECPNGVYTVQLCFSCFDVKRMLCGFCNDLICELVFVAALVTCFLVRQNGIIKNVLAR